MNGVILDSDILIELLRGRNAVVRRQFESLLIKPVPLFYSAVSSAEIANGARESESDAIAELLALFTCVPADCGIAAEAGDILKRFRKSHLIGLGDALIGQQSCGMACSSGRGIASIILTYDLNFSSRRKPVSRSRSTSSYRDAINSAARWCQRRSCISSCVKRGASGGSGFAFMRSTSFRRVPSGRSNGNSGTNAPCS
jgi:predicted nucleic acid-binding protein